MPAKDDGAADRRALFIFERLTSDPELRARLTASEPVEVIRALERLERAAPRSYRAFPTQDDLAPRRSVLPLPDRIGPYRFAGLLGEGGMGIVFAADRDDGLFDHRVAIKLIHPDRSTGAGLVRFDQERRLLARLDHPNIARLIDGGVTADGWPFIIMERIDGMAIDAFVRDCALSLRERVTLLSAVATALKAAHNALVIHGDIKPDNILVNKGGQPRLLDFGVARLTDSEMVAGFEPRTAAFSAPERQDGEAPTIASDVYAMGILLRSIAGNGDLEQPALRKIADPGLSAIADKAAAYWPQDRYGTIDALVIDLERWTDGLPVLAHPYTVGYVLERFIARHRVGVALATAAMLGLIAMLAFALQGWHAAQTRATDLRELARFQLVDLDQRLDKLPRTVALRAALASEAQSYLSKLTAQAGDTPALRHEAADGFLRLALLQGASDRPSLNDVAAARTTFARAEALVASDPTKDGAILHTRIMIARARMEAANANVEAAKSIVRGATLPTTTLPADLAAEYLLVRSEIAQWNGAFDDARRTAAAARARLTATVSSPRAALLLGRSYDLEAEANFYADQPARALTGYRQALIALDNANRTWPDDRALGWSRTKARWALGTTMLAQGDARAALPLLEQAFLQSAHDAAADPADQVAGRRRRLMMMSFGQGLLEAGRADEGLAMIEQSVTERRIEWALQPADSGRLRDWLVGVAALGDALIKLRRTPDACRAYTEAATLVRRLIAENRLTRLDRSSTLKLLYLQRAEHCRSD